MSIVEEDRTQEQTWFYEINGIKKDAISESKIIELIKNGNISYGTLVWKKGFIDWMKLENTELKAHINDLLPPPLLGEHINNTIVWILAFAPIIGLFLEAFIAGIVYQEDSYMIDESLSDAEFWYVTLILNIILSIYDNKRLKVAGLNTDKFRGWVWLVPVYLFQRAKAFKHNYSYFIVWIISFFISILLQTE